MPYYALLPFTILKSLNSTDQPACLEIMISLQGKSCPVRKSQASEAPINLSSHKSDDTNYKNLLESNKSKPLEAITRSPHTPKAPETDVVEFMQKDLDQII